MSLTGLGMYPVENSILGHKGYSRSNTTGTFENTPSSDVPGVYLAQYKQDSKI